MVNNQLKFSHSLSQILYFQVRHSSTESGGRGRPKPICRTRFASSSKDPCRGCSTTLFTTRSSPLVTLGTSISPTGSPGRGRTGVAWDPAMLQVIGIDQLMRFSLFCILPAARLPLWRWRGSPRVSRPAGKSACKARGDRSPGKVGKPTTF